MNPAMIPTLVSTLIIVIGSAILIVWLTRRLPGALKVLLRFVTITDLHDPGLCRWDSDGACRHERPHSSRKRRQSFSRSNR